MISPKLFVESLQNENIDFYAGVPDSLLKNLCAYIADNFNDTQNIITANEGAAVSLAAGYYLATGKTPVVYLQNSGQGNAINPLSSLTDKEVYNIPVLMLIGWRGEPGIKDEPQHKKQGKITLSLLDTIGIKYAILSKNEDEFKEQLHHAIDYINETKEAFSFVIQKDTFCEYKMQNSSTQNLQLSREEAIKIVTSSLGQNDVVVSTTGMISRELFEFREMQGQGHEKDFLTVGSMGHASQIAFGIALQQPDKKVFCYDGDGALLMHLGSIAVTASRHPRNYIHIVFNNGAHDSVGGQPTVAFEINIPKIALACGYEHCWSVSTQEELMKILMIIPSLQGPILLEIKVKKGNRNDLGRPSATPIQNKEILMKYLGVK